MGILSSVLKIAGPVASVVGIATANPWLAGAGAAASSYGAGKEAKDAQEKALQQQLGGQQDMLEVERDKLAYLQDINEVPQQFKEGALTKLGGMYGLEGGTGSQDELIEYARNSPLYAALMGSQEAGEESIMRNAAATGGLRSGNVQDYLSDYNTRLSERSLLNSYDEQVRGLTGLAGTPTNESEIGRAMSSTGQILSDMGYTTGSGTIAGENINQNMYSGIASALTGGAKNWLAGGGGLPGFSSLPSSGPGSGIVAGSPGSGVAPQPGQPGWAPPSLIDPYGPPVAGYQPPGPGTGNYGWT